MKSKKEPQKKLIRYLREIGGVLEEEVGIDPNLFFTPQDAIEILRWSDKEAEKIYNTIIDYVKDYGCEALDMRVNPWCLKYALTGKGCDECGYGKRHGLCGEYGKINDHGKIISTVREKGKFLGKILPNSVYRIILDLPQSTSEY